MTVPSTRFREDYAGNGSATSFPYAFRIFKAADLVVTKTDSSGNDTTLTLGTDYTVTGAGSYNGGAVVLTTALPTSHRLTIERVLAIRQDTDLRNQGEFLAETHEDAFDRLTMIVQRLAGYLGMGQDGTLRTLLLGTGDVDGAGAFRARGNRISGLGYPVEDYDATGKRWVMEQIAGSVLSGSQSSMLDTFVMSIDTIESANGSLWPDKIAVYAKGGATIGDNRGGVFRFLKGSSIAADGGIVHIITGGRLVRDGWTESGFLNPIRACWYPDYDPAGSGDSTQAIQKAINSATTYGNYTVSILGKPRITSPFTYSHMISLIGENGGDIFTNDFDRFPTKINCHDVTGYLFDQPDVIDGDGAIALSGIALDGRDAQGTYSNTWQGLIKGSNTSGKSVFYARLRHVIIGFSNCATPIVDVSGAVFPDYDNVKFISWPYGMAASGRGANILGTTITFKKCYFSNLRQVAEFYDNTTDVVFEDSAIESCVAGVASLKTSVYFRGGYSENMGYDSTGTGINTGLTPRSLGISDSPAIAGNVVNIFTCRYGQMIFDGFTLQNTTGGKKWFDGIGRSSALGRGGRIELRGLNMAAGSINTLFADDVDTPSSRSDFEYVMDVGVSKSVVPVAAARMLTSGKVPIQWSDGNIREVSVSDGLFTLPSSLLGISAVPTIYPDVLGAMVGDVVQKKKSAIQAGAETAWVCTTAGTSGAKWDTKEFAPLSISASVANGGTMSIPVPLVEVGTVYEYDVVAATAAAAGTACALKLVICHYASGSGMSSQILSGSGIAATYSHGNPITITNNSGATLSIYARLISVGRTHS